MPQRMIGIRVSIIRCIDDSQWPSFVECEFVDAHGKVQRFTEKSAIVTCDDVNSTTRFPHPAVIACEIVERSTTDSNMSAYLVDTELPWHVSSTEDKTKFDVLVDDLVEWEFGTSEHRPWNGIE
jgi:hypothetical protein